MAENSPTIYRWVGNPVVDKSRRDDRRAELSVVPSELIPFTAPIPSAEALGYWRVSVACLQPANFRDVKSALSPASLPAVTLFVPGFRMDV